MRLEIEIDTGDAAKARAVALALAADAKPKRGTADFSAKAGRLLIDIDCNDSVALRAAANSSLRIADACLAVLR